MYARMSRTDAAAAALFHVVRAPSSHPHHSVRRASGLDMDRSYCISGMLRSKLSKQLHVEESRSLKGAQNYCSAAAGTAGSYSSNLGNASVTDCCVRSS